MLSSRIKNKTEGSWIYVEETWPDHAINSATTVTKLMLCCVNLITKKKYNNNNNKQKKTKKNEKCGLKRCCFLY